MLPNYACWGGLEAYQRGVPLTEFVFVKIGKIILKLFFGRCQCIISLMHRWRMVVCYLIMPIGVS